MGTYLVWDTGTLGLTDTGNLFFDVVPHESHSLGATVTEHPVEQGVTITDHVRPNPAQLTVEGFVSNAPIAPDGSFVISEVLDIPQVPIPLNVNGAITAIGNAIGGLLGKTPPVAQVQEVLSQTNYVAQTLATLKSLQAQAVLLTVICDGPLGANAFYENMILESIDVDRDPGVGTGATFTLGLKEIRVVQSSIVQAPEPTIPRAIPKKSKGNQATQKAPEQKTSLAYSLLHGAG